METIQKEIVDWLLALGVLLVLAVILYTLGRMVEIIILGSSWLVRHFFPKKTRRETPIPPSFCHSKPAYDERVRSNKPWTILRI